MRQGTASVQLLAKSTIALVASVLELRNSTNSSPLESLIYVIQEFESPEE
jgi:hypothetical protein